MFYPKLPEANVPTSKKKIVFYLLLLNTSSHFIAQTLVSLNLTSSDLDLIFASPLPFIFL